MNIQTTLSHTIETHRFSEGSIVAGNFMIAGIVFLCFAAGFMAYGFYLWRMTRMAVHRASFYTNIRWQFTAAGLGSIVLALLIGGFIFVMVGIGSQGQQVDIDQPANCWQDDGDKVFLIIPFSSFFGVRSLCRNLNLPLSRYIGVDLLDGSHVYMPKSQSR